MRVAVLLSLFALTAACGVDGPPTPPQTGITVSGEVAMGISGTL